MADPDLRPGQRVHAINLQALDGQVIHVGEFTVTVETNDGRGRLLHRAAWDFEVLAPEFVYGRAYLDPCTDTVYLRDHFGFMSLGQAVIHDESDAGKRLAPRLVELVDPEEAGA